MYLVNVQRGLPSFGGPVLPSVTFEGMSQAATIKHCPSIAPRESFYAWLVQLLVSEEGFNSFFNHSPVI